MRTVVEMLRLRELKVLTVIELEEGLTIFGYFRSEETAIELIPGGIGRTCEEEEVKDDEKIEKGSL